MIYDDNLLLTTASKEADEEWNIQPAPQAVAGDKAAVVAYRDNETIALNLSPGYLVTQKETDWPGKLLILDYGPGFQLFDKYTANNSIDQFATLDFLWPLTRLILGVRQEYRLQKMAIIEASRRSTVEYIPTTFSATYQFDEKMSWESDLRRFSLGYDSPGLTLSTRIRIL